MSSVGSKVQQVVLSPSSSSSESAFSIPQLIFSGSHLCESTSQRSLSGIYARIHRVIPRQGLSGGWGRHQISKEKGVPLGSEPSSTQWDGRMLLAQWGSHAVNVRNKPRTLRKGTPPSTPMSISSGNPRQLPSPYSYTWSVQSRPWLSLTVMLHAITTDAS